MNNYRELLFGNAIQLKPCSIKTRMSSDVSVVIGKIGSREGVTIKFNDVAKMLMTEGTDRVCPMIVKNRLYIVEDSHGYKISDRQNNKGDVKISVPEYVEQLRKFVGDYELKYDKMVDIYYVEKEEDE